MKIVVLEAASLGPGVSLEPLEKFGETVIYQTTTEEEIADRITDADILMINRIPMNERTLRSAQRLKLITITATGIDGIDLEYCRSRNIAVSNIRNYSTNSVAQHTITMLLFLMEKIAYYDNYVKSGNYITDKEASCYQMKYTEVCGKIWGIVGMGNIGRKVADIAAAFGAKILYCSLSGKNTGQPYELVSFSELIERSDIVSVHMPLNEKSRGLFDYDIFCKMKSDAIFINAARGGVVVEKDLCRALEENQIAAAGLDVISSEPMDPESPFAGWQDSTRLLITPHVGWASQESRQRAADEIGYNIEAFLKGERRNRCD